MPCEILINAIEHRKSKKGFIVAVKDQPCVWGNKEGPPNYIVLTVTNADASDVVGYATNHLKTLVNWTELARNAQGRRYRLHVHPKIIADHGEGRGIKQEIRDRLVTEYGANIVSYTPADASAVVDIPNTDWQDLRRDMIDIFEELVTTDKRYKFDPADVDTVVAAGGRVTRTKAQVLAKVIDRLA